MTPIRDRTAWLQGGAAACLQPPPHVKRAWHLVLLGPPGVGKGTLSRLLFHALGACPLSTGDVFRAAHGRAAAPGTAVAEAQAQMERGHLVPDATVLSLIRERSRCLHCGGGWLLDGFPRTLAQATALDALLAAEGVPLDAVLNLELPTARLITRLGGRRVCPQCQVAYHLITQPPRVSGICDACGGTLVQRPDDCAQSVRVRIEEFHAATAPVAEHYRRAGLLVTVAAAGEPAENLAHALDGLAALGLHA